MRKNLKFFKSCIGIAIFYCVVATGKLSVVKERYFATIPVRTFIFALLFRGGLSVVAERYKKKD